MSSSNLLPDLHIGFSRGRSGGQVFPFLLEFSTVYCDPHSQRLWHSQQSRNRCFSGTLFLLMIQWMLAIWYLVNLPFLSLAWTSGSSRFTYCWSLAWRILSITLLACEMSVMVWYFEHSLTLPFLGIGMKTDLFQSCGHCWVFQICWRIECSTFTASSFRIWNSSSGIPSPKVLSIESLFSLITPTFQEDLIISGTVHISKYLYANHYI